MLSRLEGCIIGAAERMNERLLARKSELYAWHEVDGKEEARVVVVDRERGLGSTQAVLSVVFGEGVRCATEEAMTTTLLGELEELVRAVEGEEASEQFREFVLEPPMRVERSAPEAGEVLVNLDFGVGETRYTRTGNYPQNEGSLPSACAEFNQRFRASGRPWIAWPRIGTETGADIEVVTKERGLSGPTVGVQHTCALLPDAGHDASKGKLKRTVRQPDFFTAIRDALNKKEHKASRDLVLAIDLVDLQIAGTLSGLEMMEEVQELAQKSKWGAIVLCGSGMPGFAVSWVIHPVAEGERAPLPCDGFPLFDGLIEPGAGSE